MLLVIAALTLLAGPASAAIYHVDGENGTDPNDGLTWDTAKATIQAAVDAAGTDDEIWVKMGTYAISSQIQVDEAIGIYGGFAGSEIERSQRDWANNITTIDGQGTTPIFNISDEPIIDGFSLINGYNNVGFGGAAIYIGGASGQKIARVSNCIISNNTADPDQTGPEGYRGGGAIRIGIGDPLFMNCLIINNSTNAYGGGINIFSGSPQFINCTISKNTALMGGGVYVQGNNTVVDAKFYNCIISGNTGTIDANDLKVIANGDPPQGSNNCSSVEIGAGTILTDPLFADSGSDDFHLQAASPCIDAGTDSITLADTDLDMNDRIIDGDNDTSLIVDIGSYEAPCRLYPPDVLEMTEVDAEAALNALGLTKGTVTSTYSNTVAEGLVITQTPDAAIPLPCGAVVDLVISDGLPIVPNDLCDNPDALIAGIDYPGTTVEASGATESTCADNDTQDVWYSYTATADGLVNITLANSDFDTTLAVYDSCNTEELACNDDFGHPNINSQVALYMTNGATYLIRVAGYDGQAGDFTLSIDDDPPGLNNDSCLGAVPIEPNEVYLGTTIGATGPDQSGCSYNDDIDVWHTFTPQTNVSAEIILCDSNFDTTLIVYDSCQGTSLASNDDYCGLQSRIDVDLSTGSSYLIRVAGYDGETGDYALSINATPILASADVNIDGFVNYEDFARLAIYWQMDEPSVDIAPLGGNGIINMSDVIELALHWLE
jgi:hypothetical protein